MSDMKCPFCQQELLLISFTIGEEDRQVWYCRSCKFSAYRKIWEKIIRTRKALDVAVDVLKYANKCIKGGCVNWETEIDRAINKITALEQKDVK